MNDFREIDRMTIPEYNLRIEAHNNRLVVKERDMRWQAYLNRIVSATEKQGNKTVYVFKQFEDFYDAEKVKQTLTGKQPESKIKDTNLANLMLLANGGRKEAINGTELLSRGDTLGAG